MPLFFQTYNIFKYAEQLDQRGITVRLRRMMKTRNLVDVWLELFEDTFPLTPVILQEPSFIFMSGTHMILIGRFIFNFFNLMMVVSLPFFVDCISVQSVDNTSCRRILKKNLFRSCGLYSLGSN